MVEQQSLLINLVHIAVLEQQSLLTSLALIAILERQNLLTNLAFMVEQRSLPTSTNLTKVQTKRNLHRVVRADLEVVKIGADVAVRQMENHQILVVSLVSP